MPKRVQEQTKKQSKRTEEVPEPQVKKMDTAELLAEIDVALEGIDQELAVNYVQHGGQ